MEINFKYDLRSQSSGQSSIKLRFDYRGKRFVYGTGQIIKTELWDHKNQRPTKDKSLISKFQSNYPHIKTETQNIYQRIENIESHVKTFFSLKELQKETVNFDDLKNYLNKQFTPEKAIKDKRTPDHIPTETVPLLKNVIENFYKGMVNGSKTIQLPLNKRGQRYTIDTIKAYHSFKLNYNEFETLQNKHYLITHISIDFENDLHEFFNEEKEFSPNYKGKLIKMLKVIINDFIETERTKLYEAQKNGTTTILSLNDLYHIEREIKRILKPNSEPVKIYLNDDEIETLFNLDLTKIPYYDKARDIFLTGCYTALRHSDYKRLSKEHIKNDWVEIIMKKGNNNKKVFIPIRPELMTILKKWNYKIPEMTSQELNRYIKEIGKLAGINELIEINEIRGNETIKTIKQKYELITTHTARRSAATNMYNSGMNAKDIMSITGHSKIETFEKYIIKDDKAKETRLKSSEFFKGRPTHLKVV